MLCEERSRLFERYAALVHAYSSAVKDAVHLHGVEFDKEIGQLEELRKLSLEAGKDLEGHERTHSCGFKKARASELSQDPGESAKEN